MLNIYIYVDWMCVKLYNSSKLSDLFLLFSDIK